MKGIKGTKNWGVLHWILTPSCLHWLKEWKKKKNQATASPYFSLFSTSVGLGRTVSLPLCEQWVWMLKASWSHFLWSLVFKSPIRNWKEKRKTECNPQCTDNFSLPLFQSQNHFATVLNYYKEDSNLVPSVNGAVGREKVQEDHPGPLESHQDGATGSGGGANANDYVSFPANS